MKRYLHNTAILTILLILTLSCTEKGSSGRRVSESNNGKSFVNEQSTEQISAIMESEDSTEFLSDNKPSYNVYIENSGSMDGFFQGETELENALYRYLTEIEVNNLTEEFNYFYINSGVIPHDVSSAEFIKKLTPASFRVAGGNRGDTDIAEVLKMIVERTSGDEVSIMVTDGIVSPGSNVQVDSYLNTQETEVYKFFSNYKSREPESGVMIYQLSSNFNGTFYNKQNAKSQINQEILYYIWIVGKQEHLLALKQKVGNNDLRSHSANNWLNEFVIASGNQTVDYKIVDNIGVFDRDKYNPYKEFGKLKRNKRNGLVEFGIAVDFSKLLVDEDYLLNPDNYDLNLEYSLTVKKSANKRDYILHFSSERIIPGLLNIKLKTNQELPEWVVTTNDEDGVSAISDKTYGIKYQVNGLRDAFVKNVSSITEIKINIK